MPKRWEDRFWPFVVKTSDCWTWTGSIGSFGYGHIQHAFGPRKTLGAHRASWMLHFGPIPVGLCVLHRCDNPPCVNPAHLFLGTRGDNHRDKVAKGRARFGGATLILGVAHHKAKLNPEKVLAIRAAHAAGETEMSLARRYGVWHNAIRMVVQRKSWKSVP